ncbi:Pollen-specific protein [Quillaja saponaria]|uniref:Pollen-specific protein n=1 Tax=Quillaja saponaria TaxID=32244 RepID=A0AAD7LFL2_QUISA|nr:Pollen-specific protein [Quillaja saponaria]
MNFFPFSLIVTNMATRMRLLLLLALCCVLPALATSGSSIQSNSFCIQGHVYCDTCRAGFETNVTTYIEGATVEIVCKNRKTLEKVFSVKGVTDSTGKYSINVHEDHADEICECQLVNSPQPNCKIVDRGRSKSSVVLTRYDNGVLNYLHYANAMGFLQDEPLDGCSELLKYYLQDVES